MRRTTALLLASAFVLVACGASSPDLDAPDDDESVGSVASALTCANVDDAKGAALAKAAIKRNGKKSQHRCFAYVKQHLAAAGVSLPSDVASGKYAGSAYMFAKWANENPNELAAAGLARSDASLDALPKGAIVVWPRGDCGYSKVHGHIEIVVDDASSRACSDFCGGLRKDCRKAPDVFVPVKQGTEASGSPACGDGGARTDAGPPADSCVGRAPGWYCSQLVKYSAYKCSDIGTISLGYQCMTSQSCVAGANDKATLGADGYPQCGGGK